MRGAPILLLAATAAPGPIDIAQFANGVAAVGERPSDAIALRQTQAASPSFRLGAAYRAWRNASAAIAYDAGHPTGDGGDEEVLAEDCSDERIAFDALETERRGFGLTVDRVGAAVTTIGAEAIESWRARQGGGVNHCRRD